MSSRKMILKKLGLIAASCCTFYSYAQDDVLNIPLEKGKDSLDFIEIIDICNKKIKFADEDEKAYYFKVRGDAKAMLKSYKVAISDYDSALIRNSSYIDALNNRSIARIKIGEYEDAINDINRALKLDSSYVYLTRRGLAYFRLKKYDEAINDLNLALKKKPEAITVYLYLGDVYKEKGNMQEACKYWREAINQGYDSNTEFINNVNGKCESDE